MAKDGKKKKRLSTPGVDSKRRKNRTSRKKRKRDGGSDYTTPTKPKTRRPPTPTSVVTSTQKKELEEWSKEAKEPQNQFQPGNEEKKGKEAKKIIAENTKQIHLLVSKSMWPFLSEVKPSSDGNAVHLMRNEVNHNTISPSLSNEITNNFLGNPIGANRGDKLHDPTMGTDMKSFLTYNAKVSRFGKKLHFVNIFFICFCKL